MDKVLWEYNGFKKKVLINKFSVELILILLNIRDYDLVLESLKRGMSENFDNKTKTKTKLRQIKIFSLILKCEVCDHLPSDFKKIFTAWKAYEVVIEIVYKKCIAPVDQELWPLKHIIFNRDSYVLYKFTIKSAYTQDILYYCTFCKPFFK
jgi:hypothetical protein